MDGAFHCEKIDRLKHVMEEGGTEVGNRDWASASNQNELLGCVDDRPSQDSIVSPTDADEQNAHIADYGSHTVRKEDDQLGPRIRA
jgi:hypothetical protein